ncbi:MAG: aminopeptidase P family protein [Candidatus Kapabacteria bacterium]|nr:aminopeptidase P family protein [Candidatus Kapabacteria bacterium]
MNALFSELQRSVATNNIDAWVLYDMRHSNELAWNILQLEPNAHCTRRWMVIVPAKGRPVKITHRMEQNPLAHLDIHAVVYDTRDSWERIVQEHLAPFTQVAMEYSPMGRLPVISKVDAGIVELIRSFGVEVVSSADMLQEFTSVLSEDQIAGACVAAGQLRETVMDAFGFIRKSIERKGRVSEYDVQSFIMSEFQRKGLTTDAAPIVAIGPNAASPHYAPTRLVSSDIEPEMVVLIDAWCRHDAPGSVFADITWVGYTGEVVPDDVESSFAIIRRGRDEALQLVRDRFASATPVSGFEVDRACRGVIDASGMGHAFIHRTGHNITTQVHGPGANMDDFETHDTRRILPGTSFSIEPGMYIPDVLGLRTEIDVIITHDQQVLVPSEPIQQRVLPLMSQGWSV